MISGRVAGNPYGIDALGFSGGLVYTGVIDCSNNPNFPAAEPGSLFVISRKGKIGGANGTEVNPGDLAICRKSAAPGSEQEVGAYWNLVEKNDAGSLYGPTASTDGAIAVFEGNRGKTIKDSKKTITNSLSGDENAIPTDRAVYSSINSLASELGQKIDEKLIKNPLIESGTGSVVTHDSKGLVTGSRKATTDDIQEVPNKRYVSDANLSVLNYTSGTNTGDESTQSIKTKLGVASGSTEGFLKSDDWNRFNAKQDAIPFNPENSANKNSSALTDSNSEFPTSGVVKSEIVKKLDKSDFIHSINGDGATDGSIAVYSPTNKDIRPSGKSISSMLVSSDQVIATSKCIKEYVDLKIDNKIVVAKRSVGNNFASFTDATGKEIKDSGFNQDSFLRRNASFVQFQIVRGQPVLPLFVPYDCKIAGWDLILSEKGIVELDVVYNETFSAQLNSITGSGVKPNCNGFPSNSGTDLTGWMVDVKGGGLIVPRISKFEVAWAVLKIRTV